MKQNKIILSFLLLLIAFYSFICLIIIPAGYWLLSQDNTWGDIFSLGQFLADLCLVPFAILAFYLTLQELRKHQEKAKLDIKWDVETKLSESITCDRPLSANHHSPSIALINTGNTPSVHYQITFEIPVKIGRTKMVDHHWKGDRQGEFQKFIFTSESHLVSFPNAPYLNLGKIEFTETASLPQEIIIKYYIASDKDEYKTGNLKISFVEQVQK